MISLHDPVIRVPLMIRLPNGEQGGARCRRWASLTDVPHTVVKMVDCPPLSFGTRYSLLELLDNERDTPVLSCSDGIPWAHNRHRFSSERATELDKVRVAAFLEDSKYIFDSSGGRGEVTNIRNDPAERLIEPTRSGGVPGPIMEAVVRAGSALTGSRRWEIEGDVEERLRAWGYM